MTQTWNTYGKKFIFQILAIKTCLLAAKKLPVKKYGYDQSNVIKKLNLQQNPFKSINFKFDPINFLYFWYFFFLNCGCKTFL